MPPPANAEDYADPAAASSSTDAGVPEEDALVRVPGTPYGLRPPPQFALADRFPGFQWKERQATIEVTELDTPFAKAQAGMTRDGLASKGMTLLGSEPVTVDGREMVLLHVAQSKDGTEFLKWMLAGGDGATTTVIVGAFPKASARELSEPVKRAVLTATRGNGDTRDLFEGLSFTVTPTERLKVAGRMNALLILTESGQITPDDVNEGIYRVGYAAEKKPVRDVRAFSEERARQNVELEHLRNLRGKAVQLGGLRAYELIADGKSSDHGDATRLYQVIAVDGGGYFIIQARVGLDRSEDTLPEFRRVTSSFRKTQ